MASTSASPRPEAELESLNVFPAPASEHLSYPVFEPTAPGPQLNHTPSQPRQVLQDRLYVGNLHQSVDEYTLLQVFSKFGKVTKLDFLFHKSGPLKGKPRGYAFIEYGSKDEAQKAQAMAHDKLLRGRKLVVTFAHQAPLDQAGQPFASGSHTRRGMMDTGKPTTLSLLKTGLSSRNTGTESKIAMMEAKLREMEASKSGPSSSTLPSHPSLPPKPVVSLPTKPANGISHRSKTSTSLPSLPIVRQHRPSPSSTPTPSTPTTHIGTSQTPRPSDRKSTGLLGVKIVKKPKS